MDTQLPQYIVIEGPIGVGKTSLATKLAEQFNADLLLEDVLDNPFLEKFYENPREAALSAQLHFLLQRSRQIQNLRQQDIFSSTRIADFMLEKDKLFAKVNLSPDEYGLYERVYEHLSVDAPTPDLVIYLQASPKVLMERIERRARDYEKRIKLQYLEDLSSAYAEFFHRYDGSPLLAVNASAADFVTDEKSYQNLLDEILATKAGRNYYNPSPYVINL
ncbi:MAG: deoxynucleoside kinase [Pseudomonadota bacterium]